MCVCGGAGDRHLIMDESERGKNQYQCSSKVLYNVTCENISHVVYIMQVSIFRCTFTCLKHFLMSVSAQ